MISKKNRSNLLYLQKMKCILENNAKGSVVFHI